MNNLNYDLIKIEDLKDLNSKGYIYKHKKSGARVVIISNDDNNKVFSIGFRTPSENSTGVQHIIEHSILCGSKKYPAKDPFVELAKGSLNTFLNAMTYPDKTIYPVASCNDVDFANLMDVYLDAVFYPNIYNKEEIFKQEGWHYEYDMDNAILNGVVFNEMKGVYSSADDLLEYGINEALFTNSPYKYSSGGNPEIIPDLTYEYFLDYHKKHYHPANSYIYLYGNVDIEEKLNYLNDEYLSKFDKEDFKLDTRIKLEEKHDKVIEKSFPYPVLEDEEEENRAYLSYTWSIETSLDERLSLAMSILDYVLVSAEGAVLKKALLDSGIATDISSSYENQIYQPTFSIVAKNADINLNEKFKEIIKQTLEEVVANGFDEDMLNAAINFYEFKYREADFGMYPKGLIYYMFMMSSWLYDDDLPFIYFTSSKDFSHLRNVDKQEYFKEIVKKYLLENNFAASVTLYPSKTLLKEQLEKEKNQVNEYVNKLSDDEKYSLCKETIYLKEYQNEPSTKEELESIPLLSIDDIDKEAKPISYEVDKIEEVPFVKKEIFTNGISYTNLYFKMTTINQEDLKYTGILNIVLGLLDTKNYSYKDLTTRINQKTGGIYTDIAVKEPINNKVADVYFYVQTRSLYANVEEEIKLIKEMISNTLFEDKKRIKEIIAQTRSQLESRLVQSGHTTAIQVALSQYSKAKYLTNLLTGYENYKLIREIDENFDETFETLKEKLESLSKEIFVKENLTIGMTAESSHIESLKEKYSLFVKELENKKKEDVPLSFELKKKNTALTASSKVLYVGIAGQYETKYNGAMSVLKTIFAYDYLWQKIRIDGGAYGCMSMFDRSGDGMFVSYRDPNLTNTLSVYDEAADYIKNLKMSKRELDKCVIGTIGSLDVPLTPSKEGQKVIDAYLRQIDTKTVQKERDEILSVDIEKINALSKPIENLLKNKYICVVGNVDKINENKNLFDEISKCI